MTKFVKLLKASLLRDHQWADTQLDNGYLRFDELVYEDRPRDRREFPATVPMPLAPRH